MKAIQDRAPPVGDDRSFRAARLFASLDQSAFSPQHLLLYAVVIVLHLFDGYDLLMTGVVLPGVAASFHLVPRQAGMIASSVFIGMCIGAVVITMLADRIGRKKALFLSVGWYGLLSFVAATATSYHQLLIVRLLQGLGLGAEVPLVFTYLTEFVPVRRRGLLAASSVFFWQAAGLLAALTAIIVIPTYTWRGMFLVGAVPALLILLTWFFFPESPRYLVGRGRIDEAEAIVRRYSTVPLERAVVAPSTSEAEMAPFRRRRLSDIVSGRYFRFTTGVWMMNFGLGMIFTGLAAWLPSIFLRMGFTLVHSFAFTAVIAGSGALGNLVHAAFLDRIGRRLTISISFLISAVSVLAWGHATSSIGIMGFGAITAFTGAGGVAGSIFTYISELYPTEYRATGSGWATGWQRIGGILAPTLLGAVLGMNVPLFAAFAVMSVLLALSAIISYTLTYETTGKSLEDITTHLATATGEI